MTVLTLSILAEHPAWKKHKGLNTLIRKSIKTVWPMVEPLGTPKQSVTLCLSDNEHVQTLNKAYRGKDKPTNVLSFPASTPGMLGDLILAYETVAFEASTENKVFENHVVHLCVHGLLHLLGYDHEIDSEAEIMEALEIRLLKTLGIPNPYQPMA